MDNEKKQERIERYLNGKLSSQEKTAFENNLAQDADLKREVVLQQELTNTLKGEKIHQFRNVLQEVDADWKSEQGRIRRLNIPRLSAIAAAVLVLIIAYRFFLPSKQASATALLEEYYDTYPMLLTSRSSDENEVNEQLNQAISAYQNQDFESAATGFSEITEVTPDNLSYLFYQAVSLLESQKATEAIPVFQALLSQPKHSLNEQSQWYLALAHLQNEDFTAAKSTLEGIEAGEFKYEEAQALLAKLE
jgi:tetratricopeptide (TPR) repeat protein